MSWWEFIQAFWIGLWFGLWPLVVVGMIGLGLIIKDTYLWIKNRRQPYKLRYR